MRSKAAVFALFAVALSGCNDTAESTLANVAKAACANDVTKLQSLLAGEALAEFGNLTGADRICKASKPPQGQKYTLRDELTESRQPEGGGRVNHRTYQINVLDTDTAAIAAVAVASCDVTWHLVSDRICTGGGTRPGRRHCHTTHHWQDFEDCKITSLKAN